jgi:hypothetical protein
MDPEKLFSPFQESSAISIVFAITSLLFLYAVVIVIHRLYFNPLSKFPGLKLAAATLWYEFYFNITRRGEFIWEIERMHKKYG